ncbi:MAG TPA: hypothetical protein DCZ41_05475 [Firmicutes bacterium]|nr:hypothetical protein [Bacillota bacterium]
MKTKKQKIAVILSSLFLMASCSQGNEPSSKSDSSEQPSVKNILKTLQKGFSIEAELTETDTVLTGNQSQTIYHNLVDISSSSKKYRQISYKQVLKDVELTKDNLAYDEAYIEEDGFLKKLALTIENKVESQPIQNGVGTVSWDASGLSNPFSYLKEEDFVIENSIFVYSSVNSNFESGIATFLNGYGDNGGALDSFSLRSNNGSIAFEAVFTSYQATLYGSIPLSIQKTYQGLFQAFGEEVLLPTPIEKEEDASFAEAFQKLQSLNFATTIKNEEIKHKDGHFVESGTATAFSHPTSFTYQIYKSENKITDDAAYFVDKNGDTQRAVHYTGEDYYASGKSLKTKISDYWPSFKVSSAFFEKTGNVFTLDKQYLGLFRSTSLFTNFVADAIEDLSITIGDNEVIIVNSNSGNGTSIFGNRETIVYNDFGNQEAFDTKKVQYDSSTLPWEKVLRDITSYKEIATYVGGTDNMNLIPTLGGVYSEATSTEMNGIYFLSTQVSSKEEGEALIEAYAKALKEKGYALEADGNDFNYVRTLSDGKKLTLAPLVYEQKATISTSYGIFAGTLVQVSD